MQISAENLTIGHDEPLATNLFFTIGAGEVVGLVGANGSGKTTLIRTLLGLNSPLAGTIIWSPDLAELRRSSQIGVVWQDGGLPFSVSPTRWIEQLAKIHGKTPDTNLLTKLNVPINHRPIRNLSGGEKQRLAIYSAFFHSPKVLVLDEPTVGLDEISRNTFYELMQNFKQTGGLALMTSHYAMDLNSVADRIISLSDQAATGFALFSCVPNLTSEEVAQFNLTELSNGYQINQPNPWQQLVEIQTVTKVKIQNFQVIRNV